MINTCAIQLTTLDNLFDLNLIEYLCIKFRKNLEDCYIYHVNVIAYDDHSIILHSCYDDPWLLNEEISSDLLKIKNLSNYFTYTFEKFVEGCQCKLTLKNKYIGKENELLTIFKLSCKN